MRKTLVICVTAFLAAACQSSGNYGATLQPWIGRSEMQLEQSWGIPHNVFYVTPDEKVVTYVRFSRHHSGYEAYADEIYYPAFAGAGPGERHQPAYSSYYCKTSFTITNGIVSNYSFNGDDCRGEE